MAEKDVTEKLLEDHNDVFADIVNGLLFGGEQVVKPAELSESLTRSMYKTAKGKLHEQERDVVKRWERTGVNISIIGLENQSKVDRKMPLRVLGYDGAAYRSQYKEKMPAPVVTLVLYFGEDRWKKPRSLKEILKIPSELEPFVNDYKLNIYEIAWLTEEEIGRFTSDFRVVANFYDTRFSKHHERGACAPGSECFGKPNKNEQ